jgi:beta-glucosidase
VFIGHLYGTHAPGDKLPLARALRVQHNAFLSHGRGVQVIRERAKTRPNTGISCVSHAFTPVSNKKSDIDSARTRTFTTNAPASWSDAWWMDPVILGRYPEDGMRANGRAMPKVTRDEMALMSQPLDFLGINVYQGGRVRRGPDGKPVEVPYPTGNPITAFKWNLAPDSLYWAARFYYERYRLPIAVTENGMSGADWISLDGRVHDPQRIDFLDRYLSALRQASRDGVDIRGYFHWSLLDNFEWAEGFKERFGLIHVDYPTGKRTPKDSYFHYKKIIATNGGKLPKYRPMYG